MAYSLTWLPNVLLEANLKVAFDDGWETRGHGDVGPTFGVICHHTGSRRPGNMPALKTLRDGRVGKDGKVELAGPLCQLGLGRDGTFYMIAAGKAHHAGKGIWTGIRNGNHHFIGIEAVHSGLRVDPWPDIQMDAYRRGVAAILNHLRLSHERCAGHKEYAQPLGRKPDPCFDMSQFRTEVAALMAGDGRAIKRELIARTVEVNGVTRPTVRRGDNDECIKLIQRALGLEQTGSFDAKTEAGVRAFQRRARPTLVPDGIVGPKSWQSFETAVPPSDPPHSASTESRVAPG